MNINRRTKINRPPLGLQMTYHLGTYRCVGMLTLAVDTSIFADSGYTIIDFTTHRELEVVGLHYNN